MTPRGNVSGATWPVTHSAEASELGGRTHSGTLVRTAGQTRFEHDAQGRIVLKQKKLSAVLYTIARKTGNRLDA